MDFTTGAPSSGKPSKEMYQVMVIGGGTAGLRTALACARQGHQTVMVEPGTIGGTCLNTGCIPTKALLQASHMYKIAQKMPEFGIQATNVSVNFKKLMQRVNGIVKDGQDHIKESLQSSPLTVVSGKAQFVGPQSVRVDIPGKEPRFLTGAKIIICTGAKNMMVPIKGLDKVDFISNENILSMTSLPESVVMIGGGYIAMEFATFFSELGCKVTVLERAPQVLGMLDDDVVTALRSYYDAKKITFVTNANIIEVKQSKSGKTVTYNDVKDPNSPIKSVVAEELVVAIGRVPNTDELMLSAAGVNLGSRKEIVVNDFLQTSNPNIYAIGDCNGKAMFAHAAKRESQIAISNLSVKRKHKMHFELVPWAVFTSPAVSGIGLSERQARAQNIPFEVLHASFTRAGRATVNGDTRGFVKVIYEKVNKTIVGVVIIGPNADDLIHEFAAIMNSRDPTIDTIRRTIHVHPTLSEVMESLK